ncbi:MAG: DUF5684 domain-containing protein [Thermoanaerobaculia bacterium]|jgi:hypothetical protein
MLTFASLPLIGLQSDFGGGGGGGGLLAAGCGMVMFLVWAIVLVAVIAGLWKVFVKAGKPGWAAIVPIYNIIVMLEIVGKPIWWIVLMLIPIVNIVVAIIVSIALAEKFGKSAAYGIGIALLGFIFIPMLGFGDARYQG